MKTNEFQRTLNDGLAHHRAGRLAEAEACYRRILEARPREPDARHLLGLISHQRGEAAEAVKMILSAIEIKKTEAVYFNNLGEAYRALGRVGEARAAYERAVALVPGYAVAWNNLGIVREAQKEIEPARKAYERATRLVPGYFEAWHNLAVLQDRIGESAAAWETIQVALRLNPKSAPGHNAAGNTLQNLGRGSEAIAAFDRAIVLDPNLALAHYNRANSLREAGRFEEAVEGYEEAIRRKPDFADAFSNCCNVLAKLGRHEEALEKIRRAVELDPRLANAWNNLGICLLDRADFAGARSALDRALELDPENYRIYSNLAIYFQKQEKWAECFAAINKSLALKPENQEALCVCSQALLDVGRLTQALEVLERALKQSPDRGAALVNKANVLMAIGGTCEALENYELALKINPGKWLWSSNYLYMLNISDRHSPVEVAAIHCKVGAVLESSHPASTDRPLVPAVEGQPIRIGFVSPDFREHSVGRFLEPLWQHFDRKRLQVFAYSNVTLADQTTARLKGFVDGWRDVVGMSDGAACDLIRADKIDVLIDLTGHTGYNRLALFARRPAPIQASWLGYPNTTGLKCIDYRLTDGIADPPGLTEAYHTEHLVRIEGTAWCFQAPAAAPEVCEAPCPDGPGIVFCSFNNTVKCSRKTVELWSGILRRIAGSRLLLKGKLFSDPGASATFFRRLAEFGLTEQQVLVRRWAKNAEDHLALYNQAHIALDSFPYHGTTTTCEALWMGVPVVTLEGASHISRVGVSLLTNAGLSELIAKTEDEYVAIACRLAADDAGLRTLRMGLRERMRNSILMDGPRFAASFAAACEFMVARSAGRPVS